MSNKTTNYDSDSEAGKKIHPDFCYISILEGVPQKFQCNFCGRKFKTKSHIKYHEYCMTGERPFKCGQCGQGFVVKSHYEYHMRTHSGETPFVCSKCGKGFDQKYKVTRHMLTHNIE